MSIKVLGQNNPSATTNTDIYTVPSSKSAVISTLVVCNRSSTATSFRVAIRPAGATIASQMYIYYDCPILGNDTFCATIGITLATTDVVTVYSTLSTLSFNLFGEES